MGRTIKTGDIVLKIHPLVYEPAEDSILLMDNLVDVRGKKVLDMGTGTGIQAINAVKKGCDVAVGIDINPYAVELSRENAKLNGLEVGKEIFFFHGDLFKGIDRIMEEISIDKFDVVLFNAPYLPTSQEERLEDCINYAFDGGVDGRKVLDKFISEVGKYLNEDGVIQIVQSSLTGEKRTFDMLKRYGFKGEKTASIRFFYEEIQLITAERIRELL
ncbi:MAG TPA: methyltransferase domain-containing protein [Methanothermococcus okinawensis]|uniref:Release factor glutamine methyltransferase n=1 Tax=Methanofervidicoccus abyssi TaxID=2082189 RepID=A0A401HQ87_9EURY|nr:HemK2/MTQ2 family protein methyltransferase [Methanofervidicoccus abyssi]GBF36365.1 release factor glutamine methyltransferase [Methanofervidicoccus abyssi]HIP16105.1 methyltransferase domain-containing protein [Methanothermococcus okinawensis]HIP34676.1 methyltransferase domain-containing protein [Methanothermococcus okinawensis]